MKHSSLQKPDSATTYKFWFYHKKMFIFIQYSFKNYNQ